MLRGRFLQAFQAVNANDLLLHPRLISSIIMFLFGITPPFFMVDSVYIILCKNMLNADVPNCYITL